MRRIAALLTASVLVVAACGDDGEDGDDGDEAAEDPTAEMEEPEPAEPAEDDPLLDAVDVSGDLGESPAMEIDGAVETEETVRRVVDEGDGEALESGTMVDVRYLLTDGEGEEVEDTFDTPVQVAFDDQLMPPPMAAGLVDVPLGSRVVVASQMGELVPEGADPEQSGLPLEASETVLMVFDVMGQEEVSVDADLGEDLPQLTLYDFGSPEIEVPDQDPPEEVVTEVLVEGDGDEVPDDGAASVHYTGFLWDDGSEFDSSWSQGQPVPLSLDSVVEGMAQGLAGQSVGSTVMVVIPPDMGYGDEETGGVPPDSTLVFVVTIEELMDEEDLQQQMPPTGG